MPFPYLRMNLTRYAFSYQGVLNNVRELAKTAHFTHGAGSKNHNIQHHEFCMILY